MVTAPVSGSTSTAQMWQPNGQTKFGGSKYETASSPCSMPSGRSRAVRRKGKLRKHFGLSRVAANEVAALVDDDVVLGRLEGVRRQLLCFLNHFVARLHDRHAADRKAP